MLVGLYAVGLFALWIIVMVVGWGCAYARTNAVFAIGIIIQNAALAGLFFGLVALLGLHR